MSLPDSLFPLQHLLDSNKRWSAAMREKDTEFFDRLALSQKPEYLWIGCSDSRVPANQICGIAPGDVFVHRNIANVVVASDLNCLSVIQFAIDVLKIKHIMVVGHYGCSGVLAAMKDQRIGLADNWLLHVKSVYDKHKKYLEQNNASCFEHLCELNVVEQVLNVCKTTVVQDAWERQQELHVYGFIYSIRDGLLENLGIQVSNSTMIQLQYEQAIERIYTKHMGVES